MFAERLICSWIGELGLAAEASDPFCFRTADRRRRCGVGQMSRGPARRRHWQLECGRRTGKALGEVPPRLVARSSEDVIGLPGNKDVVVRLARADATAFDPALQFGVPGFSRIFVSYSLSMIPGWQDVLARALTWLAPGGELHVVDFGGQERLPVWFRAGLRQWLRLFHVTPRDELEAQLTLLGLRSGAITVFERPFRGYAQYAICRRLAG